MKQRAHALHVGHWVPLDEHWDECSIIIKVKLNSYP